MVSLRTEFDWFNRQLPLEQNENERDKIRILLVDDQNSIRKMLFLSLQSSFEIVGGAEDGQRAIEQTEALEPDVVLIDIEMPGMDGIAATRIIRERFSNTEVVILSSYDNERYISKALQAGAKSYILKNATPTAEIADAIRSVHKGYLRLSPGVFEKLNSEKLAKKFNGFLKDSDKSNEPIKESELLKPEPATLVREDRNQQVSGSLVVTPNTSSLTTAGTLKSASNDWSSMTKELVDTLPRVWTRGLLYFLMVFTGIILPWSMFSKVDETGSARGKLEPQGKVFTVDAPVSGTVDRVFVSEGELVEKQQPLLALESKPVKAELEQVQAKLRGQQKELVQLNLLRNQLVLTVNTQKQQNASQQFEKQAQIDQARQDIQHKQTARYLAQTAYDEANKEVQRYFKARNQGIISEIQVVEKKDLVREKESLLEQANADAEQAKLHLLEQEKGYQGLIHSGEIAVLKNEEQLKELEKQVGTLNSQIKENQSQIESLSYQLDQRIVKAPASGSIFQLPAQKTGTVLEPGGMVAEIAPNQSSLILKAQMPPTESGSLDPGMPVKVKFDAYPFQDYGVVEGKLVSISPTTKVVDTEEGKAENYELEVKLDRDYIQAKNKRVALRPGQTATAEVIVRQRRLIDFVLDPFKKLNKDGLEL